MGWLFLAIVLILLSGKFGEFLKFIIAFASTIMILIFIKGYFQLVSEDYYGAWGAVIISFILAVIVRVIIDLIAEILSNDKVQNAIYIIILLAGIFIGISAYNNSNNRKTDNTIELANKYYKNKKYEDSYKLFLELADNGNNDAIYRVAKMNYDGIGAYQNYIMAIKYLNKIQYTNNSKALYLLATMYYNGYGTLKKYNKAFDFYKKAHENNHLKSTIQLANMYYNGKGTSKNYKQAHYLYEKLGTKRTLQNNRNYAEMHYYGYGVNQDIAKALELYTKYLSHDKKSIIRIGTIYLNDMVIKQDIPSSIKWFKKALPLSDAQYNLAFAYSLENSAKSNITEIISLYKKSSNQGNSIAMNHLGNIYKNGKLVKKDYKLALKYYKQSAKLNNDWGEYNLAIMYLNGFGVKKDYKKAYDLFLLSAKDGNYSAQFELSYIYIKGLGVKANLTKAYNWMELSMRNGNPNKDIVKYLSDIKKILDKSKP